MLRFAGGRAGGYHLLHRAHVLRHGLQVVLWSHLPGKRSCASRKIRMEFEDSGHCRTAAFTAPHLRTLG
jgi:hypothetical protein